MDDTKVYQFPEHASGDSCDIVRVLIARSGVLKTYVELPSEGLAAIKRIASATGADYIDYLRELSQTSQSVKSASSSKRRVRSRT